MHTDELDTPAAVVDMAVLERNIRKFQSYLDLHDIGNRPHIKTHKIPAIARKQIEAGAVGITCQKLGEAEIMAQAGISDIFLPYNIIGKAKLARLVSLCERAALSVTADSDYVAEGLAAAAQWAGIEITVFVECDTGGGRCGVQTPAEAAGLARDIEKLPGLRFGGLMTYPSSPAANEFFREVRKLLAADRIPVEQTSGGGTGRMWQAHKYPEIGEHRAGMYVFGDRYSLKSGAMSIEDVSFHVLSTVVSRPTSDRGVLDAGSKALSSDLLGLQGYGLILEYPEANIYALSEEHGHVDFSGCVHKPEVGERVTILVNHCCPVTNLFNEVVGLRNGKTEIIWQVQARGALR